MIDVPELLSQIDIVDVISARTELKKQGKDYIGLCLFHSERTPSMSVSQAKQFYHCFSCGAHGNAIDFLMNLDGVDFQTAAKSLGAIPKINGHTHQRPAQAAPTREPVPPPEGTPPPDFGRNAGVYTYRTASGRTWFYVSRHETGEVKANGKRDKFFTPWTWTTADGWQKKGMPEPRPMYGLERLDAAGDEAAIVLVEGEKCTDAGAVIFPADRVVMSWPGGSQAVAHVELDPCRGRKVLIWPDPDNAGLKCRDALIAKLQGVAAEVWVWDVSDCTEDFDVASSGWDYTRVRQWSRETVAGAPRLQKHVYPVAAAEPAPKPAALERAAAYSKRDMADTSTHADLRKGWHWVLGGKEGTQRIKCMANCILPFREAEEWQGVLKFDEMRQVIRCAKPAPWGETIEQWLGSHDVRATEWLDRIGLHYSAGQVGDAILRVAQENGYHPVRDYLAGLTWDGVPRIDSWLIDFAGAKDTRFIRFVGAKFLIAACARAREPGCFVKNVLVLHGPQDAGKSWIPAILGGQWYGELLPLSDGMKATEQCSKLWIIENSDMAGTTKANDETIKKFISTRVDTYRPAYARHVVDMKRCCVFIFTANPDEIFTDTTGNVRYWPVTVPAVNRDALKAVRDQLWAEAAARQSAGETYWIDDQADDEIRQQTRAEQDKRVVYDEWSTRLRDWLSEPERRTQDWFRLVDIMDKALGLGSDRQTLDLQRRAGALLRNLGFEKSVRDGGKAWVRKKVDPEWEPDSRGGMFED